MCAGSSQPTPVPPVASWLTMRSAPGVSVAGGHPANVQLSMCTAIALTVTVLPVFMQWIAVVSPANYALRGMRHAILEGASLGDVWGDIWPLLVIGVVAVPLGLEIFRRGETYAKRHGKLKRSG